MTIKTTSNSDPMDEALQQKVIKLAAQICWMHGHVAGNRLCQDWSGETDVLDSLTTDERNKLQWQFEEMNSQGDDYIEDYFPYDEMVISFNIAHALDLIANA